MLSFFTPSASPSTTPVSTPRPGSVATVGRSPSGSFDEANLSARLDLAGLLLKRSSIAKIFPEYVPELQKATAEQILQAHAYPGFHPDSILIGLASHPCVVSWVQNALATIPEIPPGEAGEAKKAGIINGVALILAQGFDKVQEPNPKRPFFQRDASGKIIGILNTEAGMPNARFAECHAILATTPLFGGRRRKTLKKKAGRRKTKRRV